MDRIMYCQLTSLYSFIFLIYVFTLSTVTCNLTPIQRGFTPDKDISCAQCSVTFDPALSQNNTPVAAEMQRLMCFNQPQLFFKPCKRDETNKPRGCGKIVTFSKVPTESGNVRKVELVRRFCASTGMEKSEVGCSKDMSQGGSVETCICGTDNCNTAHSIQIKSALVYGTMLAVLFWFNACLV